MKTHQVICKEPGKVKMREVSCFCSPECDCFSPKEFNFNPDSKETTKEPIIEVGTWVLVDYDGDLYPGTVTQIVDEQYEVDTMSRAGENRFFVPSITFPGDKVWYYQSDTKSVIPAPMPATSSARHFSVLPEIWNKLNKT
ncbi:hypothetical protein LDENG_00002470 [Lucifuga dentata]|nr:hypothetical protein LDENG_00002470 [Lucifuga dentata]